MRTILVFGLPSSPIFLEKIRILKSRLAQAVGGDQQVFVHVIGELRPEQTLMPSEIKCSYIVYNPSALDPLGVRDFATEIETIIETYCKQYKQDVKIKFNGMAEDVRFLRQ